MKPILWLSCWLCCCTWASAQKPKEIRETQMPSGTERRAAVIIANENYTNPKYLLTKTHQDADDMKKVLESLGFEVLVFKYDLDQATFHNELENLKTKLQGYSFVFFYYSGHGAEYEGENYMIGVDVMLKFDSDIKSKGVNLDVLHKALKEARVKTSVIALDACRSLPIGKGEVPALKKHTNIPAGTVTLFATSKGSKAYEDGKGHNSYMTKSLKKNLLIPNLTLSQIYYNIRKEVKEDTQENQIPDIAPNLEDDLVFLTQEIRDPNKVALEEAQRRLQEQNTQIANLKAALIEQKNNAPHDNTLMEPAINPRVTRLVHTEYGDIEMMFVEGGSFEAGSKGGADAKDAGMINDKKQNVSIENFWISKYEVPQAFWRAVMGTNPSYNIKCDACPVEQISWNNVNSFLDILNSRFHWSAFRLPSEVEWEYAARGGKNWQNNTMYSDRIFSKKLRKIYNDEQIVKYGIKGTTHPVNIGTSNELGIVNMSDNVGEWCNNWFEGPSNGIISGGSWYTDSPNLGLTKYRNDVGFRLVFVSNAK